MENHAHCAQGKHLKCCYILWYLGKGALTLMPAQMDGYTNICHGERDKGMDLPANVNLPSTTEIIGAKSICTFIGFGK